MKRGGDPVGVLRIYFKREYANKLRTLMKNQSPSSVECQDFIMDTLGRLETFLTDHKMSVDELFKLLEIGPNYVKTLEKSETSDQFKEVHYDFAEAWDKW